MSLDQSGQANPVNLWAAIENAVDQPRTHDNLHGKQTQIKSRSSTDRQNQPSNHIPTEGSKSETFAIDLDLNCFLI